IAAYEHGADAGHLAFEDDIEQPIRARRRGRGNTLGQRTIDRANLAVGIDEVEVWRAIEQLELAGELVGHPQIVVVEKRHQLATGCVDSVIARHTRPTAMGQSKMAHRRAEAADTLSRIVGRSIVANQDLKI